MTDQNTGNTLAEVRLEFTVSEPEPEPNPGLSVTDSLEFGTKEEGYKELPDAKKVTVTNTGNTKIVLKPAFIKCIYNWYTFRHRAGSRR